MLTNLLRQIRTQTRKVAIVKNRDGRAVFWFKFPLKVNITPEAEIHFGYDIRTAMYLINIVCKKDILQLNTVAKEGVREELAHIEIEMSEDSKPYGATVYSSLPLTDSLAAVSQCKISLSPKIPKLYVLKVVLHEFYHALGIDHNNNKKSIMSKIANPAVYLLSNYDKKSLKKHIKSMCDMQKQQ